jgi:hypothetical protein
MTDPQNDKTTWLTALAILEAWVNQDLDGYHTLVDNLTDTEDRRWVTARLCQIAVTELEDTSRGDVLGALARFRSGVMAWPDDSPSP